VWVIGKGDSCDPFTKNDAGRTGSKITVLVLGLVEDSVVRSDSRGFGVAGSSSKCAIKLRMPQPGPKEAYSRSCIAARSRVWDTIKPSEPIGHRQCRLIWLILHQGVPLRGTRPSGHQTIEATAHLEDDPATPKPRLSDRTTEYE
jgi:hypothetical protein